jgi:hypothetical protein
VDDSTEACLWIYTLVKTGHIQNLLTWYATLLNFAVQELFKEKHYMDLEGGILEGFGRLLKFDLKVNMPKLSVDLKINQPAP